MAILNYTTQIGSEKTIAEIQGMLSRAKAVAVMTEFDSEQTITAISFKLNTSMGTLCFRLPGEVQKVYQVIVRDKRVPARLKTKEQASRVTWRIVKDGLAAQLAWVEAGLVDMEQIFLPYAQNCKGETVYETLKTKRFEGLALPSS